MFRNIMKNLTVILLIVTVIVFIKINNLYARTYTSYIEDTHDNYLYFNNEYFLNIGSFFVLNVLDNREMQFSFDGANIDFLSFPINSNVLSLFLMHNTKTTDIFDSSLVPSNFLGNNINLLTKNKYSTNINLYYNSLYNNYSNTISLYTKQDEGYFLFSINYSSLRYYLNYENSSNNTYSELVKFKNLIEWNYSPINSYASITFTNMFYGINMNNGNLLEYSNIIPLLNVNMQKSLGDILNVSYDYNPDNKLIKYHSQIYFGKQNSIYKGNDNLLVKPEFNFNELGYKVNNISNLDFLSNNMNLNYGLNFDINNISTNNNFTYWVSGKESQYGIFFNDNINLFNKNKVYLLLGSNLNYLSYNAYDFDKYKHIFLSPKIKILYYPDKFISLYISYSKQHRIPHIYEKYTKGYYFISNNLVYVEPNYNLNNESGNYVSTGFKTTLFDANNVFSAELKGSFFYNVINNYIEQKITLVDNNYIMQFINVNRAFISGYNLNLDYILYNNVSGGANYTYTTGCDQYRNYLNNLLPSRLIIYNQYYIKNIKTYLGIRANFFNKFNKFSKNNNMLYNKPIPNYAIFDIYIKSNFINKNLSIDVELDNILNKEYVIPYSIQIVKGRSFFMNLNWKL